VRDAANVERTAFGRVEVLAMAQPPLTLAAA
jgi:hypothetical protein